MNALTIHPGKLSLRDLRQVLQAACHITLSADAAENIEKSVACVNDIVKANRTTYGINTGFGLLASTHIEQHDLEKLQRSIVLSHAAGVGAALDDDMVRLIMVLKINSLARERIEFQGLPARICWVGLGLRAKLGLAFNEMVRSGEVSAPIVIGRDHLDSGSVASPNRETESMQDGSDAVSDWPLLNALLNTAGGATWVSLHHGGGVGMGFSQHSGVVIVCDGTDEAAARIARVLTNDPATGVMRHADAGYQIAINCAHEQGLNFPMITGK